MADLELDVTVALRTYELAVALDVGRETIALVGPSGAGKSTVLRAVAGLLRPDAGRIAAAGRTWFDRGRGIDLPPEHRSVGLVFQDYALFPHLTVRRNVAFGGGDGARVDELLERLRIAGLAGERPGALSGGERQRVALARALAREPRVLLLDEPLSALDAHTRALVRAELHDVLGEAGLPALLVTHDVRDALALADRIGVLVDGRLRQLAGPAELLARPADPFVAALTGACVLFGVAAPAAGHDAHGTVVTLDDGAQVRSTDVARGRVAVVLGPWEIEVETGPAPAHLNALEGRIDALTPDGPRTHLRVGALTAELPAGEVERRGLRRGDPVTLTFAPGAVRLLAAEG